MQPLNSPPIAVSVLGIKQLDDHTAVPQCSTDSTTHHRQLVLIKRNQKHCAAGIRMLCQQICLHNNSCTHSVPF